MAEMFDSGENLTYDDTDFTDTFTAVTPDAGSVESAPNEQGQVLLPSPSPAPSVEPAPPPDLEKSLDISPGTESSDIPEDSEVTLQDVLDMLQAQADVNQELQEMLLVQKDYVENIQNCCFSFLCISGIMAGLLLSLILSNYFRH